MSENVTVTRSSGYVKVEPIIPGLLEELSFFYKFKQKIKKRIFVPSAGQYRDIMVDGPLRIIKKHLYNVSPNDDYIVTYDGLLQRVKQYLEINNVDYTVEGESENYVEPEVNERVFEGLYPDQKCAVELMLNHDGGCLIEAATNTGKTRIITALCRAYSQYRGLVVTNRQSVATKLYKDLQELAPECQPGVYLSNKKKPGRTLVITSASLAKFKPEDVDFIIYDEAHGAGSAVRSRDLLRYRKAVKYGMSATIRSGFKGIHKFLEAIFGPIVFELTDQQLQAMNRATPLNVYAVKVDRGPNFTEKAQDLTIERNGIWYNRYRNAAIKKCVDNAPKDQQLIIYVRTLKHLEELLTHYLDDSFAVFHGQLPAKEKEALLQGFNDGSLKRIISTDCLAEGVDPKNLFVIINANWMQSDVSVLQKAGRNRRLSEGKSFGVVIDFTDEWADKPSSRSNNRLKHYVDRGYNVVHGCDPEDIKFVNNTISETQ